MGFADEVAAESRTSGTACKTCKLLAKMDKAERAEVLAVLADPEVAHSPITRALNRRGYDIGVTAVTRHRNRCNVTS